MLYATTFSSALAGQAVTSFATFNGSIGHVATGNTNDTTGACAFGTGSSASLTLPGTAGTVRAAYLYWAGIGPLDNAVTLDGAPLTASRTFTDTVPATAPPVNYFGAFVDVTAMVQAKGSGVYVLDGLTVDWSGLDCGWAFSGWALVAIFDDTAEPYKVVQVWDGFEPLDAASITYNFSGFQTPLTPDANFSFVMWEGDEPGPYSHNNEWVEVESVKLSNAVNQQTKFIYNATVSGFLDPDRTNVYGVDVDGFDVSSHFSPGATTALAEFSTGGPERVLIAALVLDTASLVPVSGTVFEDVNYGGGAGRDQATASGVARSGARVELYDAAGVYVTFTTTDGSGNYSFTGLIAGDYTVRVVNSTVTSSRTGYIPGLLSAQTYRTDASSGAAVPVTNRVGGQDPSVADAGNGSAGATMNTTTGVFTAVVTGTAQSITNVSLGAADVTGVDFGFNFDTIVNSNPAGQGSLDQFLSNANNLANAGLVQAGLPAGIETSLFMIPGPADSLGRPVDSGWDGSTFVIALLADLPIVIDPVRIDGYTQENAQPNTVASPAPTDAVLLIKLDGTGAGLDGFNITGGGSTVRGMIVTRFSQDGIELASNNNTVEGNYIGTDAFGASLGNVNDGVRISFGSNNVVGGPAPAARNVISGNGLNAVVMTSVGTTGNIVQGNYIGTNVAGILGLGNGEWGLRFQGDANSNTVGGPGAGDGNVISDNGIGGIRLNGTNTVGQVIQGNLIGTDATGTGNLGNSGPGIHLEGEAWDTIIGGIAPGEANSIAFNGGAGITILDPGGGPTTPSYENPIRGNSIHSNGGLGIDLDDDGPTGNDAAPDNDDGANKLQNYPLLVSAGSSGGSTNVTGTLTSGFGTTYDIDFYSNPAADVPTGFGEGEVYLGSDSVTTDGTGVATINSTLPVAVTISHVVTATATDPNGNTSEFGPNVTVTALATISGSVYHDINNNGNFDAGELGVGDVWVKLVVGGSVDQVV
ncbi:MAG: hypothetical protein OER80_14540, partial [Gammaproteobacteria bacterium]|nr:hypothetical protein [Gammaproteobacteria bacterium]